MKRAGAGVADAVRVRGWFLFLGLALYGVLSAPAPPDLRLAEMAIGALLLATVGVLRPVRLVGGFALRDPGNAVWEAPAMLALAWLLWIPLLRGAWVGWRPADMLRDIVPLLYLFLPLLLVPLLRGRAGVAVRWLGWGMALAGLAFALRWWKQMGWGFGAVGTRVMADGAVYLLNAPSVLFAAIALPVAGFGIALRGGVLRTGLAAGFLAGGLLCLGALGGAVHRMALGLAVLAFAAVAVWWRRRAPLAVGTGAMLLAGFSLAFSDSVAGALFKVAEKNRLAGANTRWEEAAAVLDQAVESPANLLFGQGWGALIANPAVGGWRVTYTHTLPTYALAKTGLFGAMAFAVYALAIAWAGWRALRFEPLVAWAVLPPIVMALFVHTSFKYLDTGLLLTMLFLVGERRNALSSG